MGMNDFTGGSNPTNNNNPPSGGTSPIQFIPGSQNDDDVSDYIINYNEKFKLAGNTLFRDEIVQQTLSVLIGKNKPNALLVGAAGVGKTKIVEDLAYRLEKNDPLIPDVIKGYTIYELPLSNIVAGSSFVGQVEEKANAVIDFMTDPDNKAILFIDEIHMLMGESGGQTYEKIAQILKPALARGDMKVIGATTLQEATTLYSDPAFNRRFTRLIVDELSRHQTVEILKQVKPSFFKHYKNRINIPDSILETVAIIADEYTTAGSHRPDNALTLLDRAIGDAVINRKIMEIKAANDQALLQAIQSVPLIPITEKQIKITAMKLMTGNNKKDDVDEDELKASLSVIKGQDDILEQLLDMIKRNDLSLFPKKTPLTLLFAGASGVGKTEVTKIIAKGLTGVNPITLNMTEYHSPASINRIIGSPTGYVGSDSNTELPFDHLEANPYQVILLDEFEKCDPSVQRLFMSAFDEGFIKTNRGKLVDFSKSIIIATTNAAAVESNKQSLGFGNSNTKNKAKTNIKSLSQWFDTELLNRFQAILTFNMLDKDIYKEIITTKYETEVVRIRSEKPRIVLLDEIPDDELETIIEETYVPEFGARPAVKVVREYIEKQVL